MAEVNPFQSPTESTRRRPFFSRLWHAFKRGVGAYRNQLSREGVTGWEQLRSWIALLLIVIGFLLIVLFVLAAVVMEYWPGWQSSRR